MLSTSDVALPACQLLSEVPVDSNTVPKNGNRNRSYDESMTPCTKIPNIPLTNCGVELLTGCQPANSSTRQQGDATFLHSPNFKKSHLTSLAHDCITNLSQGPALKPGPGPCQPRLFALGPGRQAEGPKTPTTCHGSLGELFGLLEGVESL